MWLPDALAIGGTAQHGCVSPCGPALNEKGTCQSPGERLWEGAGADRENKQGRTRPQEGPRMRETDLRQLRSMQWLGEHDQVASARSVEACVAA